MRRLIVLVCIVFSLNSFAQDNAEIGLIGGVNYYMGDINTSKLFYKPSLLMGFVYRYNISKRYSIRGGVLFTSIKADDKDFSNKVQQDRGMHFSSNIMDVGIQFEYNFFDFWIPKIMDSKKCVPYVSAGLGITNAQSQSTINIPVSIGIKYIFIKNICLGVEWTFKKTFTDKLDYVSDPWETGVKSNLINNDWYSYAALSLTYRFTVDKVCRLFDKMHK